jgi:asparagine synthase (glutamine-hydrolysing)
MIGSLEHRGPDGFGMHIEGPIGLAHARLSIIDLDGGWQPLANEDDSVIVVFNGEFFNYIELRADLLSQGHRFSTASDTEVIVHLYEQHGHDFVRHLNGQFAIALWDKRRERLLLARDRTGIRPLFYAVLPGRLAFASEAKALLVLPDVPRLLDPVALGQTFTFWSPLAPRTPFVGIEQLPPGHLMVCDGRFRSLKRYWDWSFPSSLTLDRRPLPVVAGELRELLLDAVKLQLRADVPVGAYLSGGLDSSAIAALVRSSGMAQLRTFSIAFEDAEFDESEFQRRMAAHLGTAHTTFQCSAADIAAGFPRAVRHAEMPLLRTAPVPMMLLAREVRAAGYRVVLTGEGADEVFAGYDLFKEAKLRRWLAGAASGSWRASLLTRLYPWLSRSPVASRAFAQQFFGREPARRDEPTFGHEPRWDTTARGWQFFSREQVAALGEWSRDAEIEPLLPESICGWSPLARDQYVESQTLLPGYLLSAQGDRMAMAHSIEARFPFLDHRVIEFGNRLAPSLKLLGLREKRVLREAVADLLPAEVGRRVKQPYRAPDASAFFVDGHPVDYVAELLQSARLRQAGFFDPAAVGRLLDKCRAGRAIGFADNMAFVGIISTMLLDDQLRMSPDRSRGAMRRVDAVNLY